MRTINAPDLIFTDGDANLSGVRCEPRRPEVRTLAALSSYTNRLTNRSNRRSLRFSLELALWIKDERYSRSTKPCSTSDKTRSATLPAGTDGYSTLAARFMADERVDAIYSHPGLCLTVLPHREIHLGQSWRRQTGYAELMILPLEGHDGRTRGVPFGVKARLILLYLMTEAVKTRSRQIELGRSMRAWMTSMGVPSCGKNIKTIADQCDRIEHCVLSFKLNDSTEASLRDGIIRGSFRDIGVEGEPRVVELSQGFYDTIIRRPVPVVEAAVRTLADTCMPLDLYLWLAYRLHVLERPVPVSWASLHAQFGAGTSRSSTSNPASSAILSWPRQSILKPAPT